MTPAPLTRRCSSCDGTGRIAGRWCPVCAGRGWHPATAQCVPGQRAGVWACRTGAPWCEQFADYYRDTRFHPCDMTLLHGRLVRRPRRCIAGDFPCTVTP